MSPFAENARLRNKVPLWLALLAVVGFLIVYVYLTTGVLWIYFLGLLGLAILSWRSGQRWRALQGHTVELAGDELYQRDREGEVVARISLQKPFTYEYLARATGSAVYQLRQTGQRLTFTSEAPLAKNLARDLLRQPWPPIDPQSSW